MDKYAYPYAAKHWREKPFTQIRRADYSGLLEHIKHHHGRSQADAVLAILRGIGNWWGDKHDEEYVCPLNSKMRRDPRKVRQRARKRFLNSEEIRWVWQAADGAGTFGALVQMLLLTGQR